jgi:hypothetical protein
LATAVVRVEERTHNQLRQLSEQEHRPIGQIVTELVDDYQRRRFWDQVNESVDRLREDSAAWESYQNEIAELEGGSSDGLEFEEPYYSPDEEEEIRAEFARAQSGGDLGR